MKTRFTRVLLALAIVAASLATSRPVRAEEESGRKCNCYSWIFRHHGTWSLTMDGELNPLPFCNQTDCWVDLNLE